MDQLKEKFFSPWFSISSVTRLLMCVCGNPAYFVRAHWQGPYKGAVWTPDQQEFSKSMSSAYVSVE